MSAAPSKEEKQNYDKDLAYVKVREEKLLLQPIPQPTDDSTDSDEDKIDGKIDCTDWGNWSRYKSTIERMFNHQTKYPNTFDEPVTFGKRLQNAFKTFDTQKNEDFIERYESEKGESIDMSKQLVKNVMDEHNQIMNGSRQNLFFGSKQYNENIYEVLRYQEYNRRKKDLNSEQVQHQSSPATENQPTDQRSNSTGNRSTKNLCFTLTWDQFFRHSTNTPSSKESKSDSVSFGSVRKVNSKSARSKKQNYLNAISKRASKKVEKSRNKRKLTNKSKRGHSRSRIAKHRV